MYLKTHGKPQMYIHLTLQQNGKQRIIQRQLQATERREVSANTSKKLD